MAAGLAAGFADLVRLGYPEPETPISEERKRQKLKAHLADYFRVVLRDALFLRLLLVSVVANLIIIYVPFLLGLFAKRELELSDSAYGSVVLLWQTSPILGCLLLPRLVRWLGWRRTYPALLAHFVVALGLMAATSLVPPTTGTATAVLMPAAFILMGLGSGWVIAETNVLYAIASEVKRPSYLVVSRAVSNTFGLTLFIGTALLGSGGLPYGAVFTGLTAAFLATVLFALFAVRTRQEERTN